MAHEHDGSGYARQALTNEDVTSIAAGAKFDADNVTFATLQAGTHPVKFAVLYEYNASDAAAKLVSCFEFADDFNPNGFNLVIAWHANGIFTTQNA